MTEVLTHTKRRDFQNCPRYFYHRHELHLSPRAQKGGRRRGSAFGQAVFDVLEDARAREHTSLEDAPPLEDLVFDSIERSFAEVFPNTQEQQDEIELEKVKIQVMAVEYVRRYGLQERREVEFDLPLINPATGGRSRSWRRGGKIDGMVPMGNRRVDIIEDKFVGQIQKAMIDRLPLDSQSTEYVDAVLSMGWDARVRYRHTLNPQSKPKLVGTGSSRHRESLVEYQQRLTEDVATRPDHYFDEQVLIFPVEHLEQYRLERWGIGKSILRARRLARQVGFEQAFPKNPSRCWEFGGCEFIPLCTMQPDAADRYVVIEDNPELTSREENDGITSEYAGAEVGG